MAADWFRRFIGNVFGRNSASPQKPKERPGPTPRDQWLVSGIYFDTSGWSLESASTESMAWTDGPATITLTRVPREPPTASHLDSLRRQQRALARAAGGDIVSVDGVARPQHGEDLQVVTKRHHGLGFAFTGIRTIRHGEHEYAIRIEEEEMWTGIREATVTAQMVQVGELELGEADRLKGTRRILNMIADPYDMDFDDDALLSVSDDVRLDPVFPDHPLTRIRAMLRRIEASLELDGVPASGAPVSAAEAGRSPGRPALSLSVLREVYWGCGRNDLLQAHLFECLAAVDPEGDSRDPDAGRMHLMLGHALHNSGNVAAATGSFRRAYDIFSGSSEHRRRAGVALAALGRSQRRLDRLSDAEQSFRSAVAILDEEGDESMHFTFALSWLADILAQQDRMGEAVPFAQRLAGIVEERPVTGSLASLHEVIGGTPPATTARINALKSR